MSDYLSLDELREALSFKYCINPVLNESRVRRKHNVDAFMNISRDGLSYNELEKRVLLYTTNLGEEIFMQFPGKESIQNNPKPYDFRPELKCTNGEFIKSQSFIHTFEVLINLQEQYSEYYPLISAILLNTSYLYHYSRTTNSYPSYLIDMKTTTTTPTDDSIIDWYSMNYSDEVWSSLNHYIGEITLYDEHKISFEAFIKYIDILFQNEDCKYYYRSINNPKYNFENGRNNSCDSHLSLLYFLEGNQSLASFIGPLFTGRGVSSFAKKNYDIVTDGIVINTRQ